LPHVEIGDSRCDLRVADVAEESCVHGRGSTGIGDRDWTDTTVFTIVNAVLFKAVLRKNVIQVHLKARHERLVFFDERATQPHGRARFGIALFSVSLQIVGISKERFPNALFLKPSKKSNYLAKFNPRQGLETTVHCCERFVVNTQWSVVARIENGHHV
jgi:hypothetical protein